MKVFPFLILGLSFVVPAKGAPTLSSEEIIRNAVTMDLERMLHGSRSHLLERNPVFYRVIHVVKGYKITSVRRRESKGPKEFYTVRIQFVPVEKIVQAPYAKNKKNRLQRISVKDDKHSFWLNLHVKKVKENVQWIDKISSPFVLKSSEEGFIKKSLL